MFNFSPIALFAFDRPENLSNVLEGLKDCKNSIDSPLYVFCDGPKLSSSLEQKKRITEVRKLVNSISWHTNKKVVCREENFGLAQSIISGITEVLEDHDRVIVLEDDIVPTASFIDYCNNALKLYEDEPRVMQIASSVYDNNFDFLKDDTFFAQCLQCHGWATWKRAWQLLNTDALDHLTYFDSNSNRRSQFDLNSNAYFFKQLRQNVSGEINTWAVKWYASILRNDGLILFPKASLITNIGFDDNLATNTKRASNFLSPPRGKINLKKLPVQINDKAQEGLRTFWNIYRNQKINQASRNILRKKIHRIFQKVFRKLIISLVPELKQLLNSKEYSWRNVIGSKKGSYVSEKAVLYAPYSIKNSIIGDFTYVAQCSQISYTEIGKYCSIGPEFKCGWGIHPIDGLSTSPSFYSANPANEFSLLQDDMVVERKKITIGNDVFIGRDVTVLDGVSIGDGAVIGAGTIVYKDVPEYSVVSSNTMKEIRHRNKYTAELNKQTNKWWNLPEKELVDLAQRLRDDE